MKKRLVLLVLTALMLLGLCACSDPKSDATPTNIQQQIDAGTL